MGDEPALGFILHQIPFVLQTQIQGKKLVFSAIPAAQLAKSPALGGGKWTLFNPTSPLSSTWPFQLSWAMSAVLTARSQEDSGHETPGHGKAGAGVFLGCSWRLLGVSPALRLLLLLAGRDERQGEACEFSVNTTISASHMGSAPSLNSLSPWNDLAYPGCTINAMKRPLLPGSGKKFWADHGL